VALGAALVAAGATVARGGGGGWVALGAAPVAPGGAAVGLDAGEDCPPHAVTTTAAANAATIVT
jgi:hypothetical protein